MNSYLRAILTPALLAFGLSSVLTAQTGLITTVAGTGVAGAGGVGGPAVKAQLTSPGGICVDSADNLYIVDMANNRVVRVDAASGILTLVAGNGAASSSGDFGPAVQASLNHPYGVALDAGGNLFISESASNRIRRVDATGVITTAVGNGIAGYNGDGGPAASTSLSYPAGIALDASGNLYIADVSNQRIRRVDRQTGIVTTVAGNGGSQVAPDGSVAVNASLLQPVGIAIDHSGNLLISEMGSSSIRRVDGVTGVLTTVAGNRSQSFTGDAILATGAGIGRMAGNVAVDSAGNLYFADGTGRVRRVDAATGLIGTVAGNGSGAQGMASSAGGGGVGCYSTPIGDNGPASNATLDGPVGVSLTSNGNLLMSDWLDCRIRRVSLPSPYPYTTVTLTGTTGTISSGQQETYTATVSPIGATGTPTGSVQFVDALPYSAPIVLATAQLNNGTITLWTNALGVGNHNIVAYYSGNGLFNGSGSPAIPLTVSSRALPTITLSSSMNPVVVNASTVITVTVTGNSSQPTGSVQLFDGGTLLTTGTLTNGTMQYTATFTTSGTHPLSAVYSGDGNFSQATSLTLNQVVQPLTNVVLTVDSNPSTVGSSVTFTATLTPSSASGTVQFTDSGVSLGTAAVVNGRATLSVANLGLGVHYIQAIYTGDSATAPGSSSPLTQTVRAATTTVLSTSATPSTYSQAITFTAAVSPSSATGTVQFLDGAAVLGSAPVSLGSAVLTVSSLVGGSHTITAIYSGDSANSGSTSAPLSQSVSPASPVITITTLSNPTTVGSFLLFNMSMKPASPSAALQVFDGQTLLATVNNSTGGAASYSTTTLAAGFHSITASWAGDSNVLPGVSAVLNEQIQSSTAISVTATGPVTYGQSVTVTATVSPATASGNVMFNDGGSNLGTVPLTGGVASISYVPSSAGSHLTVATFNDPNNIYIGSVANVTINVAQVTTSATVAVSPNPSNVGQVATLTATLSPAGATGNMMFYDGATFIGTGTLSNGTASMSYLFRTGGSHSITASFQGNNNYAAATSPAVMQIVKTATTTTVSGAGTSTYEQAVSLVATVAPAAATGTIQFLDGTTPLGAVTTAAGSATLNISTLGAGSHAITAIYSGDANYAGSTSAVVTQTVQKASVTVTLSSNANPSVAGQTLGLTAAISDPTATGTIQFLDGSTVVGASAIASGSAGFNTSALLAGSHSLTAVYSGDANFNTSTSTALAQTVKATTSTSLGADTVTPAFGQTIHLTSSITPAGATGTVQFLDGVTLLGAVTVSGGTATLPISLSTGSHTISAAYSGDANDGSSTSAALAVTVGKASSLVALSSSVNPSAPGQAVTLTAGVTPTSATGSVQFLDGTTVLGTSALSGGSATLSISNLTSGNHAITATYSGDGNYSGNSASLSQTVKATTTTSLAANPSPAVLGQTVQLTASISPSSATGTVQFLDGSTALGTAAASNGAASLSIATLQVGAHSLTAVYSGDGGNIGSTSAVLALTVSKASSTVTLAAAPNPITIGQSVTFTATVSPSSATGSVQFLDGAAAIGTVTLNGGAATLIAANLAAGAHSVTAVYSGDANTSGSNSTVVTVTVAKAGASVTLGSSPNPSLAGQTVAFTATVSPGSATGSVQFLDGATAIGTAAVSAGVATLSTTGLAAGSHSITAVYSGDTSYNGATSGVVTQAVTAVTTTSLSANKTTAVSGQAVTFTATVSPAAAPGSVQFLDAATTIGTVTLSGGAAVLAVSNLAVGSHSVTASYLGAAGYTASTSAAVSVTITPAPPGAPASLTATAISSSQINLSWTASATSGVTYNVYAAAAAGFAPSASNRIASGLSATSYANTGLTPAATRYYLVTAQNANGESAASNQASATTQASGLSCSVVYTVTTQWNVGFGTAITIKNTGSTPINGWQLKWTWAGNQQITEAWNSNYTQSGANATLTNAAWNSTIAAGSTVSGIGFNGSYSGSNPAPAAFYVNGTLCH